MLAKKQSSRERCLSAVLSLAVQVRQVVLNLTKFRVCRLNLNVRLFISLLNYAFVWWFLFLLYKLRNFLVRVLGVSGSAAWTFSEFSCLNHKQFFFLRYSKVSQSHCSPHTVILKLKVIPIPSLTQQLFCTASVSAVARSPSLGSLPRSYLLVHQLRFNFTCKSVFR